ncbi:MAG: hypothetical protein LBD80_04000 [Tannerella sp.]|jgi:hypothetical protein|nr:hypothetical protein [Tannerella sp.]
MKKIIFILLTLCSMERVDAQVGVNTETMHETAVFQITSPGKDKGVVFPYLIENEYESIVDPADGLWVYSPSTGCFHYYKKGAGWTDLCGEQIASISTDCNELTITNTVQRTGQVDSITGMYVRNQPLNSSNMLILRCYVKKVGNYNITAVVGRGNPLTDNGYSFSASGMATTTGWTDIVLQGQGIPQQTGIDKVTKLMFLGNELTCVNFPEIAIQPDVANYSLNCSSVSVSGEYRKGISLNTSNKISIGITVSQPGSYSMTATSNSGITFSASGYWSEAGHHEVDMIGAGTPTKNEPIMVNIKANTPQGENNCTVKVDVIIPRVTYAIIGSGTWSWANTVRINSLSNGINFGPNGTFKVEGFAQLWQTTNTIDATNRINNGYTTTVDGIQYTNAKPDIVLFYGYGSSLNSNLAKALANYVNNGGCLMYGSVDGEEGYVNLLLTGIFGSEYGNVAADQTGSGSDYVYLIANDPSNPIINGPFGNLSGRCWGEDNSTSGSIIVKTLPPNSVQICSAMTPFGKPNIDPDYSIVWYNDSKNIIYFGDSTSASTTSTAVNEHPAYFPNNVPKNKWYGNTGANNQQYVYNSALEFNAIVWMIKKAVVSGINPH